MMTLFILHNDYVKPNMCVCVCVCMFFVPYVRPHFWADLHEIWHVASLYPMVMGVRQRPLEPAGSRSMRPNWQAQLIERRRRV